MDRKPLPMLPIAALLLALIIAPCNALANRAAEPRQDLSALRQKPEAFLPTQSQGYPGQVEIKVGAIDRRLHLAQCSAPEVFLPAGSRAWGKTSIGIRCSAPAAWTIYVQANVSVMGQYLIAAAPLPQGHVVSMEDLVAANGDLTRLPPGIFTDAAQAVGRTVGMSLMDIVLVPARGYPLDGWRILIHPIVFWITVWVAWPISLLVALITPRQQMVQDLVTGTLMLRRSPMARHWARA